MNRTSDKRMVKSRKSVPKLKNHSSVVKAMEHSSIVSKISDCSSCDQNKPIKTAHRIEEDCKNNLQSFFDSMKNISKASKKGIRANQVASECLEYLNVILLNIEWLEREKNNALEEKSQLTQIIGEVDEQNKKLQKEIAELVRTNEQLQRENAEAAQMCHTKKQTLATIRDENEVFHNLLNGRKAQVTLDLQKLATASVQVEADVVQKQVVWEKILFNLQNRVAELQKENETLRTNVDLVHNVLSHGNGDLENIQQPVDVLVLEAYYEAEVVMTKHEHESFISELNKLNYKLWNEKFFARSRIDDELKKREVYKKCVKNLEIENTRLGDEICCLNKEIEELLDVICVKMKNKCR